MVAEPVCPITVATHNIMNGNKLEQLLPQYPEIRNAVGLDILCVQENTARGELDAASRIAEVLGPAYATLFAEQRPELAFVFDADAVNPLGSVAIRLPMLSGFSFLERLGSQEKEKRPVQRYAVAVAFEGRGAEPFTVVNLHLDAQGDTAHRKAQVETIAGALETLALGERLVVCGDTNALYLKGGQQLSILHHILEPLNRFHLRTPGTAPTHFLSRMDEPTLMHQTLMRLARFLPLDKVFPMKLDIVSSNMPIVRHGQVVTPASNHDLVWSRVDLC